MQYPTIHTRFAPTPSGYLHLGNVFSFILTWLIARKHNGSILLRIDDLDFERAREEYIADIIKTLDSLELDYDYGPASVDSFRHEFTKSKRIAIYEDHISRMDNTGLTFNCICSRKQIREASGSTNYPGTCLERKISYNLAETTVRINTQSEFSLSIDDEIHGELTRDVVELPFFVIRKKDGMPSYQVASLADDIHYDINYVVRGIDLLPSTGAQMFLANILGLESFTKSRFLHHRLLKNLQKEKLSKTQKASPVFELLSRPNGKAQIFQDFSRWIKLREPVSTLSELLSVFDMSQIKHLGQSGA